MEDSPLLIFVENTGLDSVLSFKKKSQSCHCSDKIQTGCYTSNYQPAFWMKWYYSITGFLFTCQPH